MQVVARLGKISGRVRSNDGLYFGETLQVQLNYPWRDQKGPCTITCLLSLTKNCIFENEISPDLETAWETAHLQKTSLGGKL